MSLSSKRPKKTLPKQGRSIIGAAIAISLLVHVASYINFAQFIKTHKKDNPILQPVKIRYVKKDDKKIEDPNKKKIVEVKQKKTERPENAKYKSFQDHKAEKEMKVSKRAPSTPGADAGPTIIKRKNQKPKTATKKKKTPKLEIVGKGKVKVKREKSDYEKLLPTPDDLSDLVSAGYQEYLEDEIAEGDRIDIDTTNYRYMGYMTSMRKSIELVWNYPIEAARRGMQGIVGLEFTILKDGSTKRVRVIKSSGYKMLDDAIVEAIKLASPFSPLPEGFGKKKIVISGNFRYILSSYLAGAH